MTFSEMQADVRRRMNESGTTFFTDQDVKDAINDGYAEISDGAEWYERHMTIPLLKNRRYYNLSTLLTEPFLSLRRCYNTVTGKWLTPTEPREMDYHTYRQWEQTQGQPEKYFLRGHWILGLWQKPSTDQRGLRVYYTSIPDAMSADADEPGFPQEYHYGIVEYALSDLHSQQRESKKSKSHWDNYSAYEDALRLYADGRQHLDKVNIL